MGAAICAAVAGGLQPDIGACAARVGAIAGTVVPDPARRQVYDAAYERYRALFDSLRPMFARDSATMGTA